MMKEITKRTIFGGLFVVIVIGSILLNFYAFAAVMAVTVLIGTREVCRLLPTRNETEKNSGKCCVNGLECEALTFVMLVFIVSVALLKTGIPFSMIGLLFALPVVIMLIPFLLALFSKKYSFTEMAGSCWTSLLFVALPCFLILSLYNSCPLPAVNGKLLTILLFALIWINDIFAYLSGMAFGVHPLFKRISPKKTIEGSLGGCAMTILVAYLVNHFWLHAMGNLEMMGLAAVVVVFGSLGDLCESMLKRQAGVKDSGNVIPGHGGILDRFDAMFLAVPFAFCYLIIIS
ncbi:MAG: phosphatidate cytidylyltransferase [Bacteroidia bacterium]|nr:phosphatidate cytidylyltransferase [Bacteroidia bacterium]